MIRNWTKIVFTQSVEDLYAQLAASEPPIVRYQQHTIEAQYQTILKLQARLKRVEEKLGREQCRTFVLQRQLVELGREVTKDSHNSSLPPSSDPPQVKAFCRIRSYLSSA